jgi:hypothetical protein
MAKEKKIKEKQPKFFYKLYRGTIKLFKKKTVFYHVGEKLPEGTLILSNHESSKGPLSWELFYDTKVRMMGAVEMNSGLRRLYKYQTKIYYHQKKHWNLFLARIFCLLASPLTHFFYKGLQLISIRDGFALKKTVEEACTALIDYKENTVIFPEDSSEGYLKELKSFKHGFFLICEKAYKQGHDLPIAVAYIKIKESTCLVDQAVKYSELLEKYKTREKIAEVLKDRCNELGRLDHTTFNSNKN